MPAQTGMPYWVRRRIFQRELGLANFAGGWNLRDAPTEMANNESPDCLNMTLDERGGVQKRFGYQKKNPSVYAGGATAQNLFEWKSQGVIFTQCGASIFKDNGTGAVKTFSTADRCGFAEFGLSVFAIHPVDGVFYSTDGSTWTAIAGSPKGTCLEPWQNRMLAGGDPANGPRLWATAIGDALNWSTVSADRTGTDAVVVNGSTTVTSATAAFTAGDVSKKITLAGVAYHIASVTNATTILLDSNYAAGNASGVAWAIAGTGWFNDLREHDSQPIVAIKAATGLDIVGKPGVLVFKNRSTYRVNDSNSGAYTTIDTTVGAASSISVTTLFNETFVLHQTGLYMTNGTSPLQLVSGKLQPLFTPQQIAYDQLALFCAGYKGDRVHFSLPRAGMTANNLHLELHPQQGWIVPHTDAMSCYCTSTASTEKLYGGSPTVAGQVYEVGVTGGDDGAPISCHFQTKWIAPSGGIECRFRRLRVFGRGIYSLYVKTDFDVGPGELNDVDLVGGGFEWNADNWNEGNWGPANYESTQDFWSLGEGEYISFYISESSTALAFSAPILGSNPPQVGAIALFGLDLQFIPISI